MPGRQGLRQIDVYGIDLPFVEILERSYALAIDKILSAFALHGVDAKQSVQQQRHPGDRVP